MFNGLIHGRCYSLSFFHDNNEYNIDILNDQTIKINKKEENFNSQSWLWVYPGIFLYLPLPFVSLSIDNLDNKDTLVLKRISFSKNSTFLINSNNNIISLSTNLPLIFNDSNLIFSSNEKDPISFLFKDTTEESGILLPTQPFSILSTTYNNNICLGVEFSKFKIFPFEFKDKQLFFYDPIFPFKLNYFGDLNYKLELDGNENNPLIRVYEDFHIIRNSNIINLRNNCLFSIPSTNSKSQNIYYLTKNEYVNQNIFLNFLNFKNILNIMDYRYSFSILFDNNYAIEISNNGELFASKFSPFSKNQRFCFNVDNNISPIYNSNLILSIESNNKILLKEKLDIEDENSFWIIKNGKIINKHQQLAIKFNSKFGSDFELVKLSNSTIFSILYSPFMLFNNPILIKDIDIINIPEMNNLEEDDEYNPYNEYD